MPRRHRQPRTLFACALLLAACFACADSTPVERPARPTSDTWALRTDGEDLVAVWVSPAVRDQNGTWFRFVNATTHQAAPRATAGATSVPVLLDSRQSVHLLDVGLAVEVAPTAGLEWADVCQQAHLNIRTHVPPRTPGK